MKKFIPYIAQAVLVLAGAGGGLWLKSASGSGSAAPAVQKESETQAAASTKKGAHSDKKKSAKKDGHEKPAKAAKEKGHGGGHGAGDPEADAYGFMKFSRQFVVPVLGSAGVKSLVVMDINLEVPPASTESVYSREPKLRDALLSTLLRLSNDGAFSDRLLEVENRAAIKTELLKAARSIIGEDALDVLILNITRQDV